MQFVWFWTFWYWSKESHQERLLLLNPLHGIAGNWDEWFRHEASAAELRRIDAAGRSEREQREFVRWLHRRWLREVRTGGNRLVGRFVLAQLAQVSPFAEWSAFRPFRAGYRMGGISAVILGEESRGRAEDVRSLEGIVIPGDGSAPAVMAEGFQAEKADLELPQRAARNMLRGRGLLALLACWTVQGKRPGPRWARALRAGGWLSVAGLIGYLWFAPEPGAHLWLMSAVLVLIWGMLVTAAVCGVFRVCWDAWRAGRHWSGVLEKSQVRFRMAAGLTVHGGSAGLAFCLNTLLAMYRAHPEFARSSWLWQNIFAGLKARRQALAATGVVAVDGWITAVVLEPKLRACLAHPTIAQLMTPRQRGSSRSAAAQSREAERPPCPREGAAEWKPGFAAERVELARYPGRHVAGVLMTIGRLGSRVQVSVNLLSLGISAVMLLALPDLLNILMPAPPPTVVGPSSSSPYVLWVNIVTRQPEYFRAVFDSTAWANRLADFHGQTGDAPARAEIPLRRLQRTSRDQEHGTVWIERRRRFLHREYFPGERVGHYTMPYLNRLEHE